MSGKSLIHFPCEWKCVSILTLALLFFYIYIYISRLSFHGKRQIVVAQCHLKICLKFLSLLHRRTRLVASENINGIQIRYYVSTLQASNVSLQDYMIEVEGKKIPHFMMFTRSVLSSSFTRFVLSRLISLQAAIVLSNFIMEVQIQGGLGIRQHLTLKDLLG